MFRGMRLVVVALALVGCSKKQQDGLPPATEWTAANGQMAPATSGDWMMNRAASTA